MKRVEPDVSLYLPQSETTEAKTKKYCSSELKTSVGRTSLKGSPPPEERWAKRRDRTQNKPFAR